MAVDIEGIKNAVNKSNSKPKHYDLNTKYVFNGLREYPRPQMVRDSYINLNGEWDLKILSSSNESIYEGIINVPFSPETKLSGVGHMLRPGETLVYEKEINLTKDKNSRILLHFGACDQVTFVDLNGQYVGTHEGGYTAFTLDITEQAVDGLNTLSVLVLDDTECSSYARGKQKIKSGGMFYTAQSGIWQTVWIEYVPINYITNLELFPDIDNDTVTIIANIYSDDPEKDMTSGWKPTFIIEEVENKAFSNGGILFQIYEKQCVFRGIDTDIFNDHVKIRVKLSDYELWTPDNPKLYRFKLKVGSDSVTSYFAMRKYSIEMDDNGKKRFCINHEPFFINGVLDQGYFPESLMTAPTDEALIDDILRAKDAGFNLIRKHCKIEPMRFYYHCDRLGILVSQDIVNGGTSYDLKSLVYIPAVCPPWRKQSDSTRFIMNAAGRRSGKSLKIWKKEATEMITQLKAVPSICIWTIFNEGWGQFDAVRCTYFLKGLDDTRPVDSASGWFDQGCGDIYSDHNYFFELSVLPDRHNRAFMISEYGGLTLAIKNHAYKDGIYGYHPCESKEELLAGMKKLRKEIDDLKAEGLAGVIYTQLTDIEEELNGLYTYDRKIAKYIISENEEDDEEEVLEAVDVSEADGNILLVNNNINDSETAENEDSDNNGE